MPEVKTPRKLRSHALRPSLRYDQFNRVVVEDPQFGQSDGLPEVSHGIPPTGGLCAEPRESLPGAGLSKLHTESPPAGDTGNRLLPVALEWSAGASLCKLTVSVPKPEAEFPEDDPAPEELHEDGGNPDGTEAEESKRGKITEWSAKSRMRFKRDMAKITRASLSDCHFLTLTYPKEFPAPEDHATYKNHLKLFTKWLARHGFTGYWKLEFQKRGAAHYHIMAIPTSGRLSDVEQSKFRRDCKEQWFRTVGSGDPLHRDQGVREERPKHAYACQAYLAKYLSKEDQTMPGNFSGRYWGKFNSKSLPYGEAKSIRVPHATAQKVRRIMRKKIVSEVQQAYWRAALRRSQLSHSKGLTVAMVKEAMSRSKSKSGKVKPIRMTNGVYSAQAIRELVKPPNRFRLRNTPTTNLIIDVEAFIPKILAWLGGERRSLSNGGWLP